MQQSLLHQQSKRAPTLQSSHRLQKTSGARYSPTDCTDAHRLGGYGIPAIPTQPPNYPPTECTEFTETTGGEYPPTDCTDFHRLGGYGILPYPRSHQTIFPQNSRNTQKRLAEKKNLCTSVKSVGEYPPPEASVNSVNSVGEYPPPETSVNSVNSVGGLAQTNLEWVLWEEFGGQRGYGRDAIPSYENSHGLHGCAQIRRVWHPCHTHAATKLSSHRIHGTHRNDWRRRKICVHL